MTSLDDSSILYVLCRANDGLLTVYKMVDYDTGNLDYNRFVLNSKYNRHEFDTKEEAIKKLNEWYMPHEIDKQYITKDSLEKDLIRD